MSAICIYEYTILTRYLLEPQELKKKYVSDLT